MGHALDVIVEDRAQKLVEQILEDRHVGLFSDDVKRLGKHALGLKRVGWSHADAWSLVVSLEMWAQARQAFRCAVAIGVVAIIVAICSLLVNIYK